MNLNGYVKSIACVYVCSYTRDPNERGVCGLQERYGLTSVPKGGACTDVRQRRLPLLLLLRGIEVVWVIVSVFLTCLQYMLYSPLFASIKVGTDKVCAVHVVDVVGVVVAADVKEIIYTFSALRQPSGWPAASKISEPNVCVCVMRCRNNRHASFTTR